mmetsp:Transcript_50995/g.119231  ORF Transcript_50995/g.119231 Transcript_50995/m.119231 type:complete len:231 (-) Transcript_50995:1588-2280(-)
MALTVELATFAKPMRVLSPKQFPTGTVATCPNPCTNMPHSPNSSAYSVASSLPSIFMLCPLQKYLCSQSPAMSLSDVASMSVKSARDDSTLSLRGSLSIISCASSSNALWQADNTPGNFKMSCLSLEAGMVIKVVCSVVLTVAGLGMLAPSKRKSPMIAPAPRRPMIVFVHRSPPTCFSMVALPVSIRMSESVSGSRSDSWTITSPSSTTVLMETSAICHVTSGGTNGRT